MNKFKLLVDSSCDLPQSFMDLYDVGVTDLIINFGERIFRDRKDITTAEILSMYEKTKVFPKTSSLNIPELMAIFTEALKTYSHIFYMPISSAISSINNNAHMAVSEMNAADKVTILDSKELSSGIGLEVIGVGEDIRKGLSPEQIEQNHNERTRHIKMSFVINTMDFLYKGGRCSGMTFLVGNKLHLHPIVHLDNGKMAVHKLVRGKDIDRGLTEMVNEFMEDFNKGNIDLSYPIFIPNVECHSAAKKIVRDLEGHVGTKILFPVDASGIITCHCGKDTCGLGYMTKEAISQ
jgi:DegV family protein with EDD domain